MARKSSKHKVFQSRAEKLEAPPPQALERADSVLDSIADLHIIFDRQWRYVKVNQSAVRALGLARDDLLGRSLWDVYPDILGTELETQYRKAMDERVPVSLEYYYPTTNTWWENRFFPIDDGLAVFASDTTERRRAEQALKLSEERARNHLVRLQATLDAAPIIIWIAEDSECQSIIGNRLARELCRMSETTNMSMTGHPECTRHLHVYKNGKELAPEEMPVQIVAKTGRELRDYSFELVLDDGTEHSLLGNVIPVFDSEGAPNGAIGAFVDITRRKRTEEILRESQERFRQIAENIDQIFWMADPDMTEMLYISPAYEKIFQRSRQSLYDKPKSWLDPIHPEDLPRVLRTLSERGEDACSMIYRIMLPDGSVRCLLDRAFPVYNESGEVYCFAGIVDDITERNRIEESLIKAKESERHRLHLDTIFRSIGEGVLTVATDLRVTYANDALRSMCPCLHEVRIGDSLRSISCLCDGICLAVLDKVVKTRDPVVDFRVECKVERGLERTIILNGFQLLADDNQFLGAVLAFKDATRIEELERRLLERNSFGNMIGKSKRMLEIFSLIKSLADLETTVLVTGESGTGKELVAEALHNNGVWSSGPLVKVHCAALPEGLLESELFGHVRGAFTNAVSNRIGRFQAAEGGTIFLDEIGVISPLTQLKLLRVLEQKEFEQVGDSKTQKARVRVVLATNADLEEKVRCGLFREDLYYRLKVMVIHLPPLRERTEDIPLLTEYFIRKMRSACNKNIVGVSKEVMQLFMRYRWPGNIRELKHAIEHACILCPTGTITPEYLPKELSESPLARKPSIDVSAKEILAALEKTEGNRAKAARVLGISRRTLYRRINQHKLYNLT